LAKSRFFQKKHDANNVIYHENKLATVVAEKVENAVRDNGHFFVYRNKLKQLATKEQWAEGYAGVARDQYIDLIWQIQTFLREGVSNPGSGGHKRISIRTGGVKRTVTTPVWAPLNKAYAASEPPSKVFWNKTGALEGQFTGAAITATGKVSARSSFENTKSKPNGTQTRFRIDLEFGDLPFPLYPIIGKAFRSGTHGHSIRIDEYEVGLPKGPSDQARNTVARIKFPEVRRPALRVIAGEMGVDLRRQLIRHRRPKK
jgi:hypothetical protein